MLFRTNVRLVYRKSSELLSKIHCSFNDAADFVDNSWETAWRLAPLTARYSKTCLRTCCVYNCGPSAEFCPFHRGSCSTVNVSQTTTRDVDVSGIRAESIIAVTEDWRTVVVDPHFLPSSRGNNMLGGSVH